MKVLNTLLFLSLFFLACDSDGEASKNPTTEDSTQVTAPVNETPVESKPFKVKTNIDNLRIRASAGDQGQEIGRLKEGSILYSTGEVSDFNSKITLRGITFDEPWLKVKTEQGLEGWVFAGAVNFAGEDLSGMAKQLFDRRLKAFFGEKLTTQMNNYRNDFENLKTSVEFAKNYRTGTALRDTLNRVMEEKLPVPEDYSQMPDLFWVEKAMPGYLTQLVAEGTIYYLFKDFKELMKKAAETEGTEDDEFIDLNLLVHSADSVEYFFPSWFIQTWDYGGSSLLGQGIHLKVLQKLDKVLNKSDLFIVEALEIKDLLINDMTNVDINYWEAKNKIIKEVDAILDADLNILTREDRIALETRRTQFQNPEANNIKVNHRSGE